MSTKGLLERCVLFIKRIIIKVKWTVKMRRNCHFRQRITQFSRQSFKWKWKKFFCTFPTFFCCTAKRRKFRSVQAKNNVLTFNLWLCQVLTSSWRLPYCERDWFHLNNKTEIWKLDRWLICQKIGPTRNNYCWSHPSLNPRQTAQNLRKEKIGFETLGIACGTYNKAFLCDLIWLILHFGKILKAFGNLWRVYLLFGEILNLLWPFYFAMGKILLL